MSETRLASNSNSSEEPNGSIPFEQELKETLARLRAAMVDVLSKVGANLRVPQSMTRDFSLDKSLVSKLARVIRESNPYAAALNVPGEEAMRIFVRAMTDAGASPAVLGEFKQAVSAFSQMIRRHCGDRATLEMLAANSSSGQSQKQQQQLETFRKAMFRGASAVFGVQARVHVSSHYVVPNKEDPEMLDLAIVGGLVDFRRIRSDVSWAVSTMRIIPRPGSSTHVMENIPLDPNSSKHGDAPLLCDFCSGALPKLEVCDMGNEVRKFLVPEGPVGTANAVTLYTGWLRPKIASRWKVVEDDNFEHFVTLSTPVELVIHDFYVHRDLKYAHHPSLHLYNQLPGALAYPNGPQSAGLLPLPEQIQELGAYPPTPATADVPDYSRLVSFVFDRLGYPADEFVGFRAALAYPPIPSMLLYRYDFPKKPSV